MAKKTVHIGPLPPPIGGISVYLYRLSNLNKDNDVVFLDEKTLNRLTFGLHLILRRYRFVIYHSPSLRRRLIIYLLSKVVGYKYAFVSHGKGLEDHYNLAGPIIKGLLRKAIMNAQFVQIVGEHLKAFLNKIGYDENKIFLRNAFIPPPIEEEEKIISTYSDELNTFRKSKSPLIVANAAAIVFKDGVDLYGLDMCVQLTRRLKQKFPNIGFLFALANDKDNKEYINQISRKINELGLNDSFYFLKGQKELWPLFKTADLMIRPTSSDGYGISIAEALFFDCPAIASNVSDRPLGTVLFKNRDLDDLHKKALEILERHYLDGKNS